MSLIDALLAHDPDAPSTNPLDVEIAELLAQRRAEGVDVDRLVTEVAAELGR